MLEFDALQVGTACLCIHLCKEMVLPVRDGQNIDITCLSWWFYNYRHIIFTLLVVHLHKIGHTLPEI